jgi:peptidoglycan/LPS O-acetylase OafA/YrhL
MKRRMALSAGVRQASGFGMMLFFVLSGLVIYYNYAHLVTAAAARGRSFYLWARFARLYPLFLLMMVVYVLVSSRHIDELAASLNTWRHGRPLPV